ncbi:MAG: Cas10/Cmr2 second palm domain-containing protein, partial [Vulcanisaeta sp.]
IEVLYSGNEQVAEPLLCYYKVNVGGGHIMLTRLFIEPLKALLILVSADNEFDVASLIKSITSIVRINVNEVDLIKVLKVNDPLNFIPKEGQGLDPGILSKTAFGWVMLDTHHPITENGVFKSLDEMGNYIALGVVDVDELGSRIRALAERPGVFEGFSTILSFAVNYVPMKVRESLKECSDNLVVLYSGGDDVAVYGRWDCVLEFLASVAEHVNKITDLSMSGGIAIFRTKYPIYYAYNEARRLEGIAKRDVKRIREHIGGVPGAVSMTVTEPYIIKDTGNTKDLIQSFTWNEIRAFLKIAQALLSTSSIPSSLLYRLYEIGDMVYDALRSENKTYLARALVTYAYTYIRNERLMQSLGYIVDKVGAGALKIPQYPKVDNEDVVIPNLLKLKTVINMYSLLSRTR